MENNEYKIIITNEEPTEEKKAVASNPSDTEGKTNDGLNSISKKLAPMAMVGYAKSIAGRVISSKIGTITLRTGYEEKQQREQFLYNTASKIGNFALSVATGAKVGGGWGAVIGAVLSIGSEAVNVAIRSNEISIAREQENMSIFLNQVRMGAGGRREGRTQ